MNFTSWLNKIIKNWIYCIFHKWIYCIFHKWIYFWNDNKDNRIKQYEIITSAKTEALYQCLIDKYTLIINDYIYADAISTDEHKSHCNSKRINFYDCFTQEKRFEAIIREVEILKYKLQKQNKEIPPCTKKNMNTKYCSVSHSYPNINILHSN
jgi:hypothetical protein